MTDQFDMSEEDQQKNIQEFMETHGAKGFFTVYFRQLFYRFVKQELKSATEDIEDVGRQLYFSSDGDELLDEHREELLVQCESRAKQLVEDLSRKTEFKEVLEEENLESLDGLGDEFGDVVHQRFDQWKDEGIEILEEAEAGMEPDQE